MKLTLCKHENVLVYICLYICYDHELCSLDMDFTFCGDCVLLSRAKRATRQRPQSVVLASSMCVVVQLWLLAVIGQYSLMTCPHLVPCPGRRERRSYLPWGMMVRHTPNQQQPTTQLTCKWTTSWLLEFIDSPMWRLISWIIVHSLSIKLKLSRLSSLLTRIT